MNTLEQMLAKTGSYHDYLINSLKPPEESEFYLIGAFEEYEEDRDTAALLIAVRNVVEAQGADAPKFFQRLNPGLLKAA
jgi:hypothetical protein